MTNGGLRGAARTLSRSTPTLFLVWLVLRVYAFAAAYQNFPYPRSIWISSDVELFKTWAPTLLHFHFPVGDDRWQYPPGAGVLLALPQWIANPLHIQYDQAFQGMIVFFDLALVIVLVWAGRKLGALSGGLAPAWLWVLAPIFIGPMLAARFDTVAALCAVGALVLLYVQRPTWAGAAMGIGLMIKAWPALMIAGARRRDLPRAVVGLLIGAVVVSGIGALWSHSWSFFGNEVHRGLQIESVGALPFIIGWWRGAVPRYNYTYGSLEIQSPHAHLIGLGVSLVGFALLALLAVLRLTGRLERVPGVDVAYAALLVSVSTSRVYSPQYDIWLVAVGAAVMLDRRTRQGWAIGFVVATSFFGQLVYPIYYDDLLLGHTRGVLLQVLRLVSLLTATIIAYVQVLRSAKSASKNQEHLDQLQPATASGVS